MVKVVLLPTAHQDLERIYDFLHGNDITADVLARLGDAISAGLSILEEFPEAAPMSTAPPMRLLFIPFGRNGYVVAYNYIAAEQTVFIVNICHSRELSLFK